MKKKKIGIITFHSSHNYGAMLQVYALQTILKSMINGEVKIIDFKTKEHAKAYKIIKKPNDWRQAILLGLTFFHYPLLRKRWNAFERFYNDILDKTPRYRTYEELQNAPSDFDIIISGSDQVFNPTRKYVEAYYLKFCNKSKHTLVAYAPSFGINFIPDEKVELIKNLLTHFHYLSSRELEGCSIIKELIGKRVDQVLDPVFLLTANEWNNIAVPLRIPFTSYILVYALIGSRKQMELANNIKKQLGLPIILVTNNVFPKTNADKVFYSAGPREFVNLFSNADYIITDSFHGTAFSVIFEKSFFSIIMLPQRASRITSLLESIDLKKRVLYDVQDIAKDQLEVDYRKANNLLKKEQIKSIDYLRKALSLNIDEYDT